MHSFAPDLLANKEDKTLTSSSSVTLIKLPVEETFTYSNISFSNASPFITVVFSKFEANHLDLF